MGYCRDDRLIRLGGCRTWVRHGRLASAFPARVRRGCCPGERLNGRPAWQHRAWQLRASRRQQASEQHPAWVLPGVLRAWSSQLRSQHWQQHQQMRCWSQSHRQQRLQAWPQQLAWPQQPVSPRQPAWLQRLAWLQASHWTSRQVWSLLRRSEMPWLRAWLQRLAWLQASHRAWARLASRPTWHLLTALVLPSSRRNRLRSSCRRPTSLVRSRRMLPSPDVRRVPRVSRTLSERIRPCPAASRGRSCWLCRALSRAHEHGALPQFSCPGSFPVRKEPHQ